MQLFVKHNWLQAGVKGVGRLVVDHITRREDREAGGYHCIVAAFLSSVRRQTTEEHQFLFFFSFLFLTSEPASLIRDLPNNLFCEDKCFEKKSDELEKWVFVSTRLSHLLLAITAAWLEQRKKYCIRIKD